jgi:hypothetical protein
MADTCFYTLMRVLAMVPGVNGVPGVRDFTTDALQRRLHLHLKGERRDTRQLRKAIDLTVDSNALVFHEVMQLMMQYPGKDGWRSSPEKGMILAKMARFNEGEHDLAKLQNRYKRRVREIALREKEDQAVRDAYSWEQEEKIHKMIGRAQAKRLEAYRKAMAADEEKNAVAEEAEIRDDIKVARTVAKKEAKLGALQEKHQSIVRQTGEASHMSELEDMLWDAIATSRGGRQTPPPGLGGGGDGGDDGGEGAFIDDEALLEEDEKKEVQIAVEPEELPLD